MLNLVPKGKRVWMSISINYVSTGTSEPQGSLNSVERNPSHDRGTASPHRHALDYPPMPVLSRPEKRCSGFNIHIRESSCHSCITTRFYTSVGCKNSPATGQNTPKLGFFKKKFQKSFIYLEYYVIVFGNFLLQLLSTTKW
ncbi:hypothetical protein L873DRAFT_919576 [Choiromyces venosus 120613-1]|uniref:Uncharacterized protein n=1 Tax=Choiromyces venosus 120613-1 TaxID=1336337 RepID=A0A3N4JQQ3_9PEZI|nr:hypothetical protein L873DRAFT_919576 [Choiromyces venosus 120613-1]